MSPPLSADQATRVERHTQLVAKLARSIGKGCAGLLSVEELESVGNEALVRCSLRFDPSAGASFSTYAHYRVRGAMIDAIRKRRPGRRTHRRALARLEATQALLSEAADRDQAQRASGSLQTLEQRVEAARVLVRRATVAVRLSEPDGRLLYTASAEQPDPEQLLLDADARTHMWRLVDGLAPAQRELIDALYVRGLSMTELAAQLGTSKATVSRRHAKIIDELGARARARGL